MRTVVRRAVATIGTHAGPFHCDEVLACYLMRNTSKFREGSVVRSNDINVLSRCDALVDVGGVYNHSICRYDHTGPDFKIKLFRSRFNASSAGLVYYHYGIEALSEITGIIDYADLKAIHEKLYVDIVHAIDCIDNGVTMCDDCFYPMFEDNTTLWASVARMNPLWYNAPDPQEEQAQFSKAVNLVGSRFSSLANHYVARWLPIREVVERAYFARHKFHSSGCIIYIPENLSWRGYLSELTNKVNGGNVLYCVQNTGGNWIVRFTMDERNPKSERMLFPERWRGLNGEDAEKATKISGVTFVHKKGHLLFASSLESAKAAAIEATNLFFSKVSS